MDQDLANKLFDVGGFLLFLNAPPDLEFGIDYNAWTIGPLFKGVKLIPPGLHFIYFSTTSKEGVQGIRTGFFHFFESREILVREWNPQTEDLRDETEIDMAQVENLRSNIRDFDRNMGPYPLDTPVYFQRWKKLTGHITPGLIRRVLPNNGKVSHLPDKSANLPNSANVKNKRLGKEIEREEGMEFTQFDIKKSFPPGASGDEVTRWSLDKSWLLRNLLETIYHNDHKTLLGEMQLAFVCLLMAQNFSGFNQWKQLVQLLCSCPEFMEEKPQLFVDFIDVLQNQLDECPEDFFRDILSENNFTSVVLQTFQQNIPGSKKDLVARFSRFKSFVIHRFDWDIPEEGDDDEEDAPVIVDM